MRRPIRHPDKKARSGRRRRCGQKKPIIYFAGLSSIPPECQVKWHESERGQARQVREDFRLLQAAATVYRADVVDRDRAGLAEAGHGARGFALDSPLEQGGFELALALGCIAGDGNAGAGAGGRIGFVGQNSRRERDSLIKGRNFPDRGFKFPARPHKIPCSGA